MASRSRPFAGGSGTPGLDSDGIRVRTYVRKSWLPLIGFAIAVLFPFALPAESVEQRAVFALRINDVDRGEAMVILRGRDVLVRVVDLDRAGLPSSGGRSELLDGEAYISLISLAPDVRFAIEEKEVALLLTVPAAWLGTRLVNLEVGAPSGILYSSDSSAFVNYAFNSSDLRHLTGFAEAGWNTRGTLLSTTLSRNADGSFVRGLSSVTRDDRSRLARWTLGDRFSETGALGGGAFLGGVSFSRNFDLDPYFIRFPRFGLSGAVTTPSTVDVYVNGSLVRREQLPPGQFDLQNVPVLPGSGSTRLVVRDAFGKETQITSPYYFSAGLLAPGLSDFSYSVGFVRNALATSSWDYGSPAVAARHRVGLTDSVTAGARLEATSRLVSGGGSATVRLPFGELELAAAGSRERDATGGAGSIAFSYIGRSVTFGAVLRSFTDRYVNLSLPASTDRARLEANSFFGVQLARRVSLTAQFSSATLRDAGGNRRVSLSSSVQVARGANLFLTASRSRVSGQAGATEFFAGLSCFLGNNTTANVTYERGQAGAGFGAQVQRSLPLGIGLGYEVQADQVHSNTEGRARLQYQNLVGRYELSYARVGGADLKTFSAAGAVVAIGGSVYATRPISDGFALIRVGDVPRVRGFLSNQEIGRTDAQGNILVPELLSYYGNRLSISDLDIPAGYAIDATERIAAPPFRGGIVIPFPIRKIQSLTGSVVIEKKDERLIPSFGELTVHAAGREVTSPLGSQGEFYLENLPAGRHAATVDSKAGRCRLMVDVPVSNQPFLDLGVLRCAPGVVR